MGRRKKRSSGPGPNSRMFEPWQADVRRFFCSAHAKQRNGLLLDAMETIAANWITQHPEYGSDLADKPAAQAAAQAAVYTVEDGRTNPFLHLSMHLSIHEQVASDRPTSLPASAVEFLAARRNSLHTAHHEVMECLGEMIWTSRRSGLSPDGQAYIEAVRRRATR